LPIDILHVDDRLVHGMVAITWLNWSKSDVLAVVNDDVVNDPIAKAMIPLAVPERVSVEIATVDDFINKIKNNHYGEKHIFIIVKTAKDALRIVEGGVKLQRVNIGIVAPPTGVKDGVHITKSTYVTKEDVETYRNLSKIVPEFTVQLIPSDPKYDAINLLNKHKID